MLYRAHGNADGAVEVVQFASVHGVAPFPSDCSELAAIYLTLLQCCLPVSSCVPLVADFASKMEVFATSTDTELLLPASLSSFERKAAHKAADDAGFKHRSEGREPNRRIRISKTPWHAQNSPQEQTTDAPAPEECQLIAEHSTECQVVESGYNVGDRLGLTGKEFARINGKKDI